MVEAEVKAVFALELAEDEHVSLQEELGELSVHLVFLRLHASR